MGRRSRDQSKASDRREHAELWFELTKFKLAEFFSPLKVFQRKFLSTTIRLAPALSTNEDRQTPLRERWRLSLRY
jgi:hypothetical protein